MAGDCFEKAVEVALAIGEDADIVHGLAVLRGGPYKGLRFWHAWVEVNGRAIDRSNGLDTEMDAATFRRLGRVEEAWEFTVTDALDEMERHGHYGPWVDGWESMTPELDAALERDGANA